MGSRVERVERTQRPPEREGGVLLRSRLLGDYGIYVAYHPSSGERLRVGGVRGGGTDAAIAAAQAVVNGRRGGDFDASAEEVREFARALLELVGEG